MRHFYTLLPFFLLLLMSCSSLSLQAQGNGTRDGRSPDPIDGPVIEITYLSHFDQRLSTDCGETIHTRSLQNIAQSGELPTYKIFLKNVGGSFIEVGPDAIRLSSEEFSLLHTSRRTTTWFGPGEEIAIEIVHDNRCYNFGSAALEITMAGVSQNPCLLTLKESRPSSVSETALLSLGESNNYPGLDQNDGVYNFTPFTTSIGNFSSDVVVYNIGSADAVINGLISEGHFVIDESIVFPLIVRAGGHFKFNGRVTPFPCGITTGAFIFDTEAEFGQCGLSGTNGIIPYQQENFMDCPGSSQVLSVDGSEISCGETVNFNTKFTPGVDTRKFTLENNGSIDLYFKLFSSVIYQSQNLPEPGYTVDLECPSASTHLCQGVLAPGEEYTFTIDRSLLCEGECTGEIVLRTSDSRSSCRIYLSDDPDGADGPLGPGKSLNTAATKDFRVFPTLASQSFTVETGEELQKPTNLEVIDQLGRRVKTFVLKPGTLQARLSINDLPSGLYYVRLEGGTETRRIIKQ